MGTHTQTQFYQNWPGLPILKQCLLDSWESGLSNGVWHVSWHFETTFSWNNRGVERDGRVCQWKVILYTGLAKWAVSKETKRGEIEFAEEASGSQFIFQFRGSLSKSEIQFSLVSFRSLCWLGEFLFYKYSHDVHRVRYGWVSRNEENRSQNSRKFPTQLLFDWKVQN